MSMSHPRPLPSLILGLLLLLLAPLGHAAGLLTPLDGSIPPLEIRDHQVEVVVEDGYATTTVEQTFYNPHDQALEATYSFPLPSKAALAEFTLWIDGQPVVGEVVEKQRAREIYQQEKAAGRDAGLTEQDSYKTFDTHVAPVRPKAETRVRLVYLQPAHIDHGMGRYLYPLEEGGVDADKLAFWTHTSAVQRHFRFHLVLRSAFPVDGLRMPNQPGAQLTQNGPGEWELLLESGASQPKEGTAQASNSAVFDLSQDLLVYWRHQDGLPGSVELTAYKGAGDKTGTFMLVLTPADDLKPLNQGRDFAFVLDISGSMQGKYATLLDGVERALGKLGSGDRYRIILFNDRARELTSGYTAVSPENLRQTIADLRAITPDRGTNLYAGLKQGLDDLDADRTSAIVLVTDGVANVGETEQKRFIELLKRRDVRLFTFVMGNSANRPLLDGLTRHSNGFYQEVSNADDMVGQILTAVSKVNHQALRDIRVEIDGVEVRDLTPAPIPSLYRGEQLVLLGHYRKGGQAEVTLSGQAGGAKRVYTTRFDFPNQAEANPELTRLWAFARIEQLQQKMDDFGVDAEIEQAITDLALSHGLVTDYTSMLVLREEQFAAYGIKRDNRDRRAIEQQAAQQRAAAPVQNRRVDSAQPMFNGPRASLSGGSSGGGAFGVWLLGLLLPLALWRRRQAG